MSEQQNGVAKDADGLNERHNARMARKKEVVDKKIEAAKRNAGVLVITCGTVSYTHLTLPTILLV